jgi:hypothetical protein
MIRILIVLFSFVIRLPRRSRGEGGCFVIFLVDRRYLASHYIN